MRGDVEAALTAFRQAVKDFERLQLDSLAASAEGSLATLLGRQGDYAEASEHFARAVELAGKSGDTKRIAQVSFNLGNALFRAGHPREALTAFQRSLALCKELKLDLEASFSTNGLGMVYFFQRDHELAQRYFEQSLTIKEKLGNPVEVSLTLANLALVYEAQGKFDLAKTTNARCAQSRRTTKQKSAAANPLSRAQIARKAAIAVMASPYRRHPYYWAGFVLFGDGF